MDMMNTNLLMVNPAITIFRRLGAYRAWASSFQDQIPLTELDIVLIGTFLGGRKPAEVAFGSNHPRIDEAFKSLKPLGVIAQAQKLYNRGILVNYESSAASLIPPNISFDHRVPQSAIRVDRINIEDRLKLRRNFALRSSLKGFLMWSQNKRQYFSLPIEITLLLLKFADGKTIRQALQEFDPHGEETCLLQAIDWFMQCTFLVTSRPERDSPKNRNFSGVLSPKDNQHTSENPWQQVKRDSRIPVYFVNYSLKSALYHPLALGMLRAYAESYKGGALMDRYNFLPIVSMSPKKNMEIFMKFGNGVWLFSNYLWSVKHNLALSKTVKEKDKRNITIHGGPSTPKYVDACRDFMRANGHVDIAVRGEGEVVAAELLEILAIGWGRDPIQCLENLSTVSGITYYPDRANLDRPVRTAERSRTDNINIFSSPYLTGIFDNYGDQVIGATLETNRGCPYGCTFCDWGSLALQKIKCFDMERVKSEIEWVGKHGIRVLYIADANFGIFDRDIEIVEFIATTKEKYGYPTELFANYAKNAPKRIAEIVKILGRSSICSEGIISIQTMDKNTLEVIRRSNVKVKEFNKLAETFRQEGLSLSTDLMIGLPGITVESFKLDIQYCFDKDIWAKAYPTQLLPNSPMSDPAYIKKYKIEVDDNNYLVSTYSYSTDELKEMTTIYSLYGIFEGYSLLRYILRYLQWDHGILAMDYIHKLLLKNIEHPSEFPIITWVLRYFGFVHSVPGGWGPFYNEIAEFTCSTFGVRMNSAFKTALLVNEMVMPEEGRSFPSVIELNHDFVAYFWDHSKNWTDAAKHLSSYPPGKFTITDPYDFCGRDYEEVMQYDNHQIFWELESPIVRRSSFPHFFGIGN